MAAIDWAAVLAMFPADPALAALPVPAQTDILAYVNTTLAVRVFGGEESPKLRLARIYLAAHYATASGPSAAGLSGVVTSESVGIGSASRSYAAPNASSSAWGSTSYGRLYAELLRTTSARFPRVL